jgi:membrane-associated PAP2 superfamily phosphatase
MEKNGMGVACNRNRRYDKRIHNLMVKPEGKRFFGRSRRRWEDNIKIDKVTNWAICNGLAWLRTWTSDRLL